MSEQARPHLAVPERLTRTPWWLPTAVYLPLSLAALGAAAASTDAPAWLLAAMLPFGAVLWTAMEYGVHRFAFHGGATRVPGLALLRDGHRLHHEQPTDPSRILIHPALTFPIAATLGGLFLAVGLALGHPGPAVAAFVGLLWMWLAYGVVHWRMHCVRGGRSKVWRALRQHHLRHHFDPKYEGLAFGVSTRLWDRVFRTLTPPTPPPAAPIEVWPRTRRDVQAAVVQAERAGLRLRARGAGRAFSPIAQATVTLRTDLLTGLEELPSHLRGREDLVQVAAGTPVHALTDALAERGRALANHAAWTGQSIAGAVGTASHGTGIDHAPMCDLVASVVLVTGGGRVIRVEPSGLAEQRPCERGVAHIVDDDLFHSVVAGFGSFGVITSLVLRTRPLVWLEEVREEHTWAEVRRMIAAGALQESPWFQVLVNPYPTRGEHTCVVTRRRPVAAGTRPDRRQRWIPVLFSRLPLDRVISAAMNRWPTRIGALLDRALRATVRGPIRGPMHRILDNRPLNTAAEAHAIEHGVPAAEGVEAVDRVLQLAAQESARGRWLTAPISLRYTASSEHLLAPQHGRATAMVEVISLRRSRWGRAVLAPFAQALGGRPHWGLDVLTLRDAADVRSLWPELPRWIRARARLAPGRAFDAPFTHRLGLTPAAADAAISIGPVAPVIPPVGAWAWARRVLRDPRDVALLRSVLLGLAVLPLTVAIFVAPVHPLWLAVPYWATLLLSLGRVSLTLHVVAHRPLLKRQLRGVERVAVGLLATLYGHLPGSWQAHHVAMHHLENNGTDDLSSTLWAQRDSLRDFITYLFGFHAVLLARTWAWHARRGHRGVCSSLTLASLVWGLGVAAGLWLNPWAAVVTVIVPLVVVRSALAAGNWAQHAFVNPKGDLADPWTTSATLLHARSNVRRFNDGFHATHHAHPSAHYSEMPLLFLAEARQRLRQGAMVVSGVGDFPMLAWLLLSQGADAVEARRVRAPGDTSHTRDRLTPVDGATEQTEASCASS